MSPFITSLLLLFLGLTVLFSVMVDILARRNLRQFSMTIAVLVFAVVLLNLLTGFPTPRLHFGPNEELLAVGIVLLGAIMGIAANIFFYSEVPFSLRDTAKPIVVSPIVVLPLLGTISGTTSEPLQLISFWFLSFQNGFFWTKVLSDASRST